MVENKEIWDDLLMWAPTIRKKDEQLQKKKPVHDEALPPMRKPAHLVIDKLTKTIGLDNYAKTRKSTIRSELSSPPASPAAAAPEKTTNLEGKATAEKERGNAAFQKQNFELAISHYERAIQLGKGGPKETLAVYHTNRAMAYLKISKYSEAEHDCTKALELQPRSLKAAWRRGIARREQGRLDEARQDFEKALEIEPGNKVVQEELKTLPSKSKPSSSSSSKPQPAKQTTDPKTAEKPKAEPAAVAPKADKEKNKKPSVERKRLPIKIVDEAYSTVDTTITEPTSSANATTAATAATETAEQPKEKGSHIGIQEIAEQDKQKTPTAVTIKEVEEKKPKLPPLKVGVPKTNFEFERDWKACRHRGSDVLYEYFESIPPSLYATLFRSSLDSDQFEQMLDLLESHYTKYKTEKEIYNVLQGLSQVRRIDMLVMFLGSNHKQVLQRLFARMKDKVDQTALAKTAKTYGVK
ncbi:hypothetical protein BDB00DRAFT_871941 [Zychaea mexicana]|uniref:uncharacterized protein n=1 Tax=Zychaea mexicana TaxID=64656 RepID=UPI0022FEF1A6|nr:uncharacterized protein BDB00DRAFT_871941 [Zychaea mexicana]KAI9493937.1 hypothetical protein BDB00DRAFT_871941 [Zychaea mexicana]